MTHSVPDIASVAGVPGDAAFLTLDWIHADAAGETHFAHARLPRGRDIGAGAGKPPVLSSIPLAPRNVAVRFLPEGFDVQAVLPERRFLVVLSGCLEVTASDGATRRWGPGGAFFATDEGRGKGHRTRTIDGPVVMTVAALDAAFDPAAWSTADIQANPQANPQAAHAATTGAGVAS